MRSNAGKSNQEIHGIGGKTCDLYLKSCKIKVDLNCDASTVATAGKSRGGWGDAQAPSLLSERRVDLQRFSAWQHLASMRRCSQSESAENTFRFQDDPPALVADASRGRNGSDRADGAEVEEARRQTWRWIRDLWIEGWRPGSVSRGWGCRVCTWDTGDA